MFRSGVGKQLKVFPSLFIALCLFLMPAAMAGENDNKKPDEAGTDGVNAPIETLYSVKDKTTGQLRPMTETERVAAGLPDLLNTQWRHLKTTTKKDGTIIFPLNGGYNSAVLIKRNEDGSFSETCVTSQEAANAFLNKKGEKEEAVNVVQ